MSYRSKIKNGAACLAAPFTQIVFVTPTVFFKRVLSGDLFCFSKFTLNVIYCFLDCFNSDTFTIGNHGKVLPKFYPFLLSL